MGFSDFIKDMGGDATHDPALPKISKMLVKGFRWYTKRYLKKNFNAIRLSKSSAPLPDFSGLPVLVVMNHSSWWDLLIGTFLSEYLPKYQHYIPMDEKMLPKYRILSKMGFFGVSSTPRGAAVFLRRGRAIFSEPYRALWVTAQGEFVDPRVRPIVLRSGVGYFASKLEKALILPIAIEYCFWQERTAEVLLYFSKVIETGQSLNLNRDLWTTRLEQELTSSQDQLAKEAMTRNPDHFRILSQGTSGIGGVYDTCRRLSCWIRGKSFKAAHEPIDFSPISFETKPATKDFQNHELSSKV